MRLARRIIEEEMILVVGWRQQWLAVAQSMLPNGTSSNSHADWAMPSADGETDVAVP